MVLARPLGPTAAVVVVVPVALSSGRRSLFPEPPIQSSWEPRVLVVSATQMAETARAASLPLTLRLMAVAEVVVSPLPFLLALLAQAAAQVGLVRVLALAQRGRGVVAAVRLSQMSAAQAVAVLATHRGPAAQAVRQPQQITAA